jgi:hypothetical protein
MKDHRERSARLELIKHMFAGQDWQTAVSESKLNISRATAYRLVKLCTGYLGYPFQKQEVNQSSRKLSHHLSDM